MLGFLCRAKICILWVGVCEGIPLAITASFGEQEWLDQPILPNEMADMAILLQILKWGGHYIFIAPPILKTCKNQVPIREPIFPWGAIFAFTGKQAPFLACINLQASQHNQAVPWLRNKKSADACLWHQLLLFLTKGRCPQGSGNTKKWEISPASGEQALADYVGPSRLMSGILG